MVGEFSELLKEWFKLSGRVILPFLTGKEVRGSCYLGWVKGSMKSMTLTLWNALSSSDSWIWFIVHVHYSI